MKRKAASFFKFMMPPPSDIPYAKGLEWYLEHAAYIGALARDPNLEESAQGWPMVLDEQAVKRLFKVLYACRNLGGKTPVFPAGHLDPRHTPFEKWTSLPLPERFLALDALPYEELEKRVANAVFPLSMRFMPKWALCVQHMLRAQHCLRTWLNASLRNFPDVPLVGYTVVLERTAGTMSDISDEVRMDAPTEGAVAEQCALGFKILRVEPNISSTNTTLVELFGGAIPREVLLRGTKRRTPRAAGRLAAEKVKRALILAEARTRMKPGSLKKPTIHQMLVVAGALKAYEGGSPNELSVLRASMKGLANANAVFSELLSLRSQPLPWSEMGAPDEMDAIVGTLDEDIDGAEDSNNEDVVILNKDEDEEQLHEEEAEDSAVAALVDAVVARVGESADLIVNEIDDAAGSDDVRMAVSAHLHRRTRKPPSRFNQ
jgi:hypothetical protein